ncbi:DUF6894 family protein [Pararhizobium haloflavum]|uniref:DUF6894 family protein n=1 Tax=Pararhizobium haloflavum TaxID=2037914 RepID=UPI0012FFF06B|nr:hypothetical protein [Pararhizobium haloflavum]
MRYEFVVTGTGNQTPPVSLEFDDCREARREAMRALSDLMREQVKTSTFRNAAIDVKDDKGQAIFRTTVTVE